MTPEMRAAIPRALPEEQALTLLADPAARAELIRRARILFRTPRAVVSMKVQDAEVPRPALLRCARRIGAYKGAPNRISMHPHDLDGHRIMLPLESNLELGHARHLDFTPTTEWMFTQPFALVWPVAGSCLYRIPDVLVKEAEGFMTIDIKPEHPKFRTPYIVAMFELTRETLALCGWRHQVRGSLSPQALANLRDIADQRWPNPHLAPWLELIRSVRPATIGGIVDLAPSQAYGRACALHLLAHEADIDIEQPILMGTPVTWST